MAKNIHFQLIEKKPSQRTEFFAPGRSYLLFDLKNGDVLPRTIIRSRDDSHRMKERVPVEIEGDLLKKLEVILSYVKDPEVWREYQERKAEEERRRLEEEKRKEEEEELKRKAEREDDE